MRAALLLCALALASAPASVARSLLAPATVRYCIPEEADAATVAACSAALAAADTADAAFSCAAGGSARGCVDAIAAGAAELTTLGASDQPYADSKGLVYVTLEDQDGQPSRGFEYESVAVVPAAACAAAADGLTWAALEGKRACATGFKKTAGYQLPLGRLLSDKLVDAQPAAGGLTASEATWASYFPGGCVPGAPSAALTAGCGADVAKYESYEGALAGLRDGICDVAFTKESSAAAAADAADTRLVCPGAAGGCKQAAEFKGCSAGRVPGKTIVGAPAVADAARAALTSRDAAFIASITEVGGLKLTVASKGTVSLEPLAKTFEEFFPKPVLRAFAAVAALDEAPAPAPAPAPGGGAPVPAGAYRFCLPVDAANSSALAACAAALAPLGAPVACVGGGSPKGCAALVAEGDADFAKAGGSDVFRAARAGAGVDVLAREVLGDRDGVEYYAVAVVPAAFCADNPNLQLAGLAGLDAAMTGYRKTAGWVLPFGYMRAAGVFGAPPAVSDRAVEADADVVARFFGDVCAVGTDAAGPTRAPGGGARYEGLCAGCKDPAACAPGDGYADYAGVVRAVADGAAGVGFTRGGEVEAAGLPADNFRLVAPTGGCCEVGDYKKCSFAAAPSHAFYARAGYAATPAGKALAGALLKAGEDGAWVEANRETLAPSQLFTKAATGLAKVGGGLEDYMGADTIKAYEGAAEFARDGDFDEQGGGDDGDGGLSSGAVAGIVIAVVAVLAAGAAAAYVVVKRRRAATYGGFTGEETIMKAADSSAI